MMGTTISNSLYMFSPKNNRLEVPHVFVQDSAGAATQQQLLPHALLRQHMRSSCTLQSPRTRHAMMSLQQLTALGSAPDMSITLLPRSIS